MGRYRRYYRYKGAGMGFSVFVIIVVLAVAAGYAGTKYVVYPYLLNNSNQVEDAADDPNADKTATDSGVSVNTSMPSVIIDQQDIKDDTKAQPDNSSATNSTPAPASGTVAAEGPGPYCVQFGSFTTKEGAEDLTKDLTSKGIYSYILESEGSQKVLGLPYSSQEKAKEAAVVVSAVVSDVFVVDLSTLID